MIRAAFALLRAPNGKVLLLRRAARERKGSWRLPGGRIAVNETPEKAITRLVLADVNYLIGHGGRFHCRRAKDGVDAETRLVDCDAEFRPQLSDRYDRFEWCDPDEVLAGAE
jgi:8-oxo-dGTP pyrophosphatase MutT (NUDIX family)